jgi:glycosyltransferase involved in cell wall biosynthesis
MASISGFRDTRIKIIRLRKNNGKSAALNSGMERMSGDFFLIQDADDLGHQNRVELLLQVLMENTNLAAVYSGTDLLRGNRLFAPTSRSLDTTTCRKIIDKFGLPAHDATGMYRTAHVGEMRFDKDLRIGQGVDFVWRVGEIWPIVRLGKCLYTHRINPESVTRTSTDNHALINEVIRKACLRRGLYFEPHKLTLPPVRPFYKHRKVDTVIPYSVQSVVDLKNENQWCSALRTAMLSLSLHPLDPLYYKPLLYFLTPFSLVRSYKKLKETGFW